MGFFRIGLGAVCIAALPVSACSSGSEPDAAGPTSRTLGKVVANGAPGVWELDRDQRLNDSSTRLTALVTRLDCNNGVTGKVVRPIVRLTKSQIVVTFQVIPKTDGAANCQGNKLVPYEVELGEPLDGRKLKDGQCLPGGPAETTAFCDASRWTPTLVSRHAIAHQLSASTLRVLNKDGLTTTVADKGSRPKISESSMLARGTAPQRKLVTEIELVRMTNANSGPMDSAGVVHPSMRNRLVWVVITRDLYPFESGPITKPRATRTAPSYTSYLWSAIDAQTGKFLQAATFDSTD